MRGYLKGRARGAMPVLALALYAAVFASPLGAETARDAAARYYEDAVVRFQKNEIPAAIIQLKNALRQDPDLLSAHILLARAYLLQGNGIAAEDALSVAKRLKADSSITIVLLAEAYLLQFKYRRLIDTINPDRYDADVRSELLVLRGRAYLELRELDEAAQTFAVAARLNSRIVAPLVGMTTVSLRQGRIDDADQQARKAIAMAPEDADAWNAKASVSHAQGELQRAIEEYGKAIALDSRQVDARIARAAILMDLGQDAAAAADLDYLREEFPIDPRASYLRAVLYARNNDREAALAALRQSVNVVEQLPPDMISGHSNLLLLAGLAHYSLDEFEQAEDYLKRFIERNLTHPGARKLLGSILLSRGEYERAIRTLEPALKHAPNDFRLLSLLGSAYMQKGRHRIATDLLEKAATLSRGAPDIRTQLALSRLGSGDDALAMEDLASILNQDTTQAKAAIVLAVLHLERGEFEKAAKVAQSINRHEPENLTALNLLGMARVGAGSYADGRRYFQMAVKLDNSFVPARVNLAKLDSLEKQPQKARQRLLVILSEYPNNVGAMHELARVEDFQGRPDEAIRWLEKARSVDPDALRVIVYLVGVYLRTDHAHLALEVATEAESRYPDNLDVMAALGQSYLGMGNQARAQVIFRRMTKLAGYDTKQLYRIARYLLAANAEDDAIWALQKAVQGDPDFVPAQVALAETELRSGNTDKALERARALKIRYPERTFGYRLVGDVLMHKKSYDDAVKNYRLALVREERTDLAIRVYQALRLSGRNEQAILMLENWNQSHPEDLPAKEALAEAYLQSGDLDAARRHYEQILAIRPGSANALNNLANIHAETGDPRAISYAEKAYAVAPEDPAVVDTLGWLLVNAGKPARGLRFLREAHSRAATSAEIRYHIAVALVRLGRPEEARTELGEALGAGQNFQGIEQAQALQRELDR